MLELFKKGFIFGCGFIVSIIIFAYVAYNVFGVKIPESFINNIPITTVNNSDDIDFHERTLTEQIDMSSSVFITGYEETDLGFVKAVIITTLKSPKEALYFEGDVYPEGSYYPKENEAIGEGTIVFIYANGKARSSFPYSNGKIYGLNDITLQQFVNAFVN